MKERKVNVSVLRAAPLLVAVVICGIGFLLWTGISRLTDKGPSDGSQSSATGAIPIASRPDPGPADPALSSSETQPGSSVEPSSSAPADSTAETADSAPASSEETAPSTEETTLPTEPAAPVMTTVDEDYFADALFIGDSRTDGLRLYSPVGDAKYYCGTSMSIFKVMDTSESFYGYTGIRSLLQNMKFGKIYIMFGINECGYATSAFADKFRSVIEEIRSYQPNAVIYIQSILYVTQNHEAKNPVFSTANLKEKNETLKALANGVDVFYLEVNDALNDGTDHLPSDYTGDGVHLKAKYYSLWKDYLLAHAYVTE